MTAREPLRVGDTMDVRLRQLIYLAREHYDNGEYDKAEPLLTQIVREQQGFADMFNMLGVIHHSHNRFSQAQEMFEEALRVNPNYTEAALNLAVTYNDLGKYDQAREIYARAIANTRKEPNQLDPFARGKIANMHARVADAYAGIGMNQEAEREYRKALELCPTFVDIRTKLGGILRDLGDKESAVAEYKIVKQQQPKFLPARIHLGVTLYSLGRLDEARREWESVMDDDPGNKSCRMYLDILNGKN
jgi:tetratricopeptide (TPR) repeat protein